MKGRLPTFEQHSINEAKINFEKEFDLTLRQKTGVIEWADVLQEPPNDEHIYDVAMDEFDLKKHEIKESIFIFLKWLKKNKSLVEKAGFKITIL